MRLSVTPNNDNNQGKANNNEQSNKSLYTNRKNVFTNGNSSFLQIDKEDVPDTQPRNKQDAELLKRIKLRKKKEAEYDEETVRHQTSHQQDETCKDFADKYTISAKLTASGVDPSIVADLAEILESAAFIDSIDITKDMKKVVNNFVKADACSDKAINMAMYNGTEKINEYESKADEAYKKAWNSAKNM